MEKKVPEKTTPSSKRRSRKTFGIKALARRVGLSAPNIRIWEVRCVPVAPALILGSALLKAIERINFVENIEGRKAGMHCLDLAFFGHISTK